MLVGISNLIEKSMDDQQRTPRPMIDVTDKDIKCAECGKQITELPFEPDTSRKIYCPDCFRNMRNKDQ